MNPVEKAIFNEEGNLQSVNRGNEVLFKVHEKDELQDRGRVCFLLKMFTLGKKKKGFQILMTLHDPQQFDRTLTKTDHLSEVSSMEKILLHRRNNSGKKMCKNNGLHTNMKTREWKLEGFDFCKDSRGLSINLETAQTEIGKRKKENA